MSDSGEMTERRRFASLLGMRQARYFLFLLLLVGCVTTPSGKKAFIITSESDEAGLGSQAYQELLSKERISRNAKWNEILKRVGARLARVANKPGYKWEFTLIDSPEKNAFALPGGKVAFYTGILRVCQNEAGIATVMGHEIAHATARHGGQRMTTAFGLQLGLAGLNAILGGEEGSDQKKLLMAALGAGAQIGVMLPFSRSHESEADLIGLRYMAEAGYDPREAPRFWGRFASSGEPPEFLSTHPNSRGRQAALAADLPKVMPLYEVSPRYGLGETLSKY